MLFWAVAACVAAASWAAAILVEASAWAVEEVEADLTAASEIRFSDFSLSPAALSSAATVLELNLAIIVSALFRFSSPALSSWAYISLKATETLPKVNLAKIRAKSAKTFCPIPETRVNVIPRASTPSPSAPTRMLTPCNARVSSPTCSVDWFNPAKPLIVPAINVVTELSVSCTVLTAAMTVLSVDPKS